VKLSSKPLKIFSLGSSEFLEGFGGWSPWFAGSQLAFKGLFLRLLMGF